VALEHQLRPKDDAGSAHPTDAARQPLLATDSGGPPVPALPVPYVRRRRWQWTSIAAVLAITILAVGAGAYWWQQNLARLPAGIVQGNGRIEAD